LGTATLPTLRHGRWTAARKRSVVMDVRAGRISVTETRERYLLSPEELDAWDEAFEREGVSGLQSKRQCRPPRKRHLGGRVTMPSITTSALFEAPDD
jgi:hypothetical protein